MEEKKATAQETRDSKRKVLEALISKPTNYFIKAINPASLPKSLKGKEEIKFTMNPPVMYTLAKMAEVANRIPDDIKDPDTPTERTLMYIKEMCEMIAILCHGANRDPLPDWHVAFLLDNLEAKEVLMMLREMSAKIRTDFFLPSFQIANLANPMGMMTKKQIQGGETTNA